LKQDPTIHALNTKATSPPSLIPVILKSPTAYYVYETFMGVDTSPLLILEVLKEYV